MSSTLIGENALLIDMCNPCVGFGLGEQRSFQNLRIGLWIRDYLFSKNAQFIEKITFFPLILFFGKECVSTK